MGRNKEILIIRDILIFAFILVISIGYIYRFYPIQIMPLGKPVVVLTPDSNKYHNDCLHPCIRYDELNQCYHMVQSPWYQGDDKVENPIYYTSQDYTRWEDGNVLIGTPATGYNSDPNIGIDNNGKVLCLWREVNTPFSNQLNSFTAIRGGQVVDNQLIDSVSLFGDMSSEVAYDLSPVILQDRDSIWIYTSWYQRKPTKGNRGVAIWRGTSFEQPDFYLSDTIPMKPIYTVDKWKQLSIGETMYFIPMPLKHDIWHFDLFEYNNDLYMVSVGNMDDNIMLSRAEDWIHFETYRKPLVNTHYTEAQVGVRYHLYKPTAFVKNDSLFLFYTGNTMKSKEEWRNKLFYTAMPMNDVLEKIR